MGMDGWAGKMGTWVGGLMDGALMEKWAGGRTVFAFIKWAGGRAGFLLLFNNSMWVGGRPQYLMH